MSDGAPDAVVVGAGLTGPACALELCHAGRGSPATCAGRPPGHRLRARGALASGTRAVREVMADLGLRR
ncbi:MAG TPA: hypothetical protein VFP69_14665 [Streptomyces sp.]|nr:hypothetical protein [Streptomyces sp.]